MVEVNTPEMNIQTLQNRNWMEILQLKTGIFEIKKKNHWQNAGKSVKLKTDQ